MFLFAMFLVGAFSLKEKSPTITVGSFLANNLTLCGPLFSQFSSCISSYIQAYNVFYMI